MPVPNEPDHVIVPPVQPVAVIVVVVLGHTSVAPANTGADGTGLAPTVIGLEFTLLPHTFSQYALYVPAPTFIVCVVWLVPFHFNVPAVQAVAVIATVSVPHTLPPPVIVGAVAVGTLVMFKAFEATLTPHDVEQVAVIACVVDTWILAPVAPVDHVIVPPTQPAAVIVATWPSQHSVLSAVNVGTAGAALVPITTGVDAADVPQSLVQVAVYEPGPTTLLVPVPKLFDQVIVPPIQPAADTVVVPFAHTSGTSELNTGATGAGLVPITIVLDTAEIPQASEHVAV
jgi:hypothetical protein